MFSCSHFILPRAVLGVDIGPHALVLLELVMQTKRRYIIRRTFHHSIVEHEALAYLRSFPLRDYFKAKNAVCVVPDARVQSRTIQMRSDLSKHDMRVLLALNTEKYFNRHAMDIVFDCCYVEKRVSTGVQDVLIVAIERTYVLERVNALRNLGMRVIAVDIASLALQRLEKYKTFLRLEADSDALACGLALRGFVNAD